MQIFIKILISFFTLIIFPNISSAQWTNIGLNGKNIRGLLSKGDYLIAGEYQNYYQGGRGGIYRTNDGGNNWEPIGADSVYYPVSSMISKDDFIFVATQGGGVFRSSNNGLDWISVNSGLPPVLGFFANYVGKIASNGLAIFAGTNLEGFFYSNNDGISWIASRTPPPPSILSIGFKNNIVFVGTSSGVYRSDNNGIDFYLVSRIPSYACAMLIQDSYILANRLVFGDSTSGLYKSINDGESWTLLSNGLPSYLEVYSIYLIDQTILIGGYRHETQTQEFFCSYNNGENWNNIRSGLPENAAVVSYAILNDNLYIGTSTSGVWVNSIGLRP